MFSNLLMALGLLWFRAMSPSLLSWARFLLRWAPFLAEARPVLAHTCSVLAEMIAFLSLFVVGPLLRRAPSSLIWALLLAVVGLVLGMVLVCYRFRTHI